jgi:hypothetical protein
MLLVRLFLHYWHLVPAWLRYSLSAAVALAAVVGWICLSEAWIVWILVLLVAGFMALYGEPSESEKKGYRF